MFNTCPICICKLGSWSFWENCTNVDEYDEKCRLCNPCKLHRGYAIKIKDCNSCIEEIYDSHTRGFPCFNCHYDKCDQVENTYPGMIGKNLNETGIIVALNCFGRKNQVYASTVGITREFCFYVIAVKTMITMIKSLLILFDRYKK